MIRYTNLQLATVIAIPIISILLIWTVAIFHKNRKKWGPYDIPIVSLLVLSILRNACVMAYVLVVTLNEEVFDVEYCSIVVWLFNSIHTFQASVLTTIAVIGLFSSKLHRKKQNLRQFLTTTHIVYHLFCLTTLCACVGVAAILAKSNDDKTTIFRNVTVFNNNNPCSFLPFDLDMKFNIFILVLHISLAVISFGSFILICYYHLRSKTNSSFDYLKKSNSDLSDLSLGGLTNTFGNDNKNYFDTYTVQKNDENIYDIQNQTQSPPRHNLVWNSDMSNISTTVSSTNSRRPCISKKQYETIEDWNRTGLETIHPVLIVSYLFYHLPLIVLCIYPKLIYPHSVAGFALWLGLLQDLLIPIGLGIVDSRFCKWVANVYRCSGSAEDKLPHIGLDGKFRPFGSSQPQSLEINQPQTRQFQNIEHRFPISTGNLYTSIDGNNRLPIIQNYRRQTREPPLGLPNKSASNISLHHNSHLKRQDYVDKHHFDKIPKCMNCEANLCPSHSDLHHLSPEYINKQLNHLRKKSLQKSAGDLNRLGLEAVAQKRLIFQGNERLSRSHESIHNSTNHTNLQNINNGSRLRISQQDVMVHQPITLEDYPENSSDEEYVSDANNYENSSSCNSITTEANCDFEFFNKEDIMAETKTEDHSHPNASVSAMYDDQEDYFSITSHPIMSSFKPQEYKLMMQSKEKEHHADNLMKQKNFKITRSNSKRSLENFQTYIETDINANVDDEILRKNLQRSNSYMTLEDRRKLKNKSMAVDNDYKLKMNIKQKNKSVECIPPYSKTVYVHDINYHVGSVPDFKKVFISEYI